MVAGNEFDARRVEQAALERNVGVILIGIQNARHGVGHWDRRTRPEIAAAGQVTWPRPYGQAGRRRPPPAPYIIGGAAVATSIFSQAARGKSMPMLLPATIAGSLPKPSWLAPPNQLWAPWLLEGVALAEAKRDAVRLVVRDQEQAGIDIISDGEQTRRHFVTTFIENLDGVDFEHNKTVRIRNRYD